ncbi:hypothetical protein HK405_006497, partial [Cladochytrium tenue]
MPRRQRQAGEKRDHPHPAGTAGSSTRNRSSCMAYVWGTVTTNGPVNSRNSRHGSDLSGKALTIHAMPVYDETNEPIHDEIHEALNKLAHVDYTKPIIRN